MSAPSLVATGLSRTYGRTAAVDGVSLTLKPGEITALIGPSGAGKSTLLRLLAGLERPDAGTLRSGPRLLASADSAIPTEQRRIGLIFQDFALFPHLDAAENIRFGLHDLPKAEGRARAMAWLERIGLDSRAAAYPHQLSGGEQQRIAIARALAPGPVAILMDEPFSGLDLARREDVREMALATIAEAGIPALLVTHDAEEALLHADRIAFMQGGRIVQAGTPDEVYRHPADAGTAAALGRVNRLNATSRETGTVRTPFGEVSLPASGPERPVTVIIRPEGILIDPLSATRAVVVAVRPGGPFRHVRLKAGAAEATALVPAPMPVRAGDEVGVRLDPALTFVFERQGQGPA